MAIKGVSISLSTTLNSPNSDWIEYDFSSTEATSIPNTSWAFALTSVFSGTPGGTGASGAGTGDAAWAVAGSLTRSARKSTGQAIGQWSGLDNAKTYNVYGISSYTATNRASSWTVNGGGTAQIVNDTVGGSANTEESAIFLGVSPVSGVITIEFENADSSSGDSYAAAIAIEEVASAAVTTTDTLQPGEDFTLTATNYASAPVSPATFTDSEGSTITVPVTISGSGPYTAVGTMPTLAEAVTAGTSLLFGDVTIELST